MGLPPFRYHPVPIKSGSIPPPYAERAPRFEAYFPAMQWLVEHDCDIEEALSATEAAVRSYPAAPDRERFLAKLAALGKRP